MAAGAGAVRAGGAYVEIFAKDGAFQQAMTRVQNKLKAVGTAMRQMGTNLSLGGAALGAPFVIAAREAANFTLSMAQVRANTKATEDQFAKLNAAARQMGVQMGQSPTEVANAMNELAKAGVNADGVIAGIGPVLALAAADNMELARAVEVVIGTMSQFGLSTGDFGSIADRLQAAANASVTSVDLIGESLSYVGPQAQAAGQSLDDVLAAMGALAQGGIRGSMAGTQLARVLEAMTSEEAKFNALGVSVRDATGNLRPFMDVIRDLGGATAGMNNADRLAAFMDIFDIRGARAAITLSNLGGEFARIMGEIQNSAGAASGKAAQVLDSFGGAVRRLGALFADLKIATITSMGETATATVNGLGRMLQVVTMFIERNPQLVATVAAVAGGMLGLGAAAIVGGIGLQVMSKGASLIAAGVRLLPALFTPAGLAAAVFASGVTAAIVIGRQLSPTFRRETDAIGAALSRLDFGAAFGLLQANMNIVLTRIVAGWDMAFRDIRTLVTNAAAFIGDKLADGLDRFMGLFGADILTLQSGFQKLGLYFQAAFDWNFAINGLRRALKEVDAEVARARERAPTADARAADRDAARGAAAGKRQAADDKNAQGWLDTIAEMQKDADRARDRANGVVRGSIEATAAGGAAAAAAVDRGVMPVGATADDKAGAAGGSRSVGTFGSGEGLGIGPELNTLEDSSKATAENTAQMVQQLANRDEIEAQIAALRAKAAGGALDAMPNPDALDPARRTAPGVMPDTAEIEAQIAALQQQLAMGAVAGSPAATAMGAVRTALPAVGPATGGSVAAGASAPAIERQAGGVQAGMQVFEELRRLSQVTSDGLNAVVQAVAQGTAATVANGQILKVIANNTARTGETFA
jgi:TP901 family phage tail tape measure protein